MSRVFWDTMLFVYLLEDDVEFAPRVREVLERSYTREDSLFTSHLALGEVMAGGSGDRGKSDLTRSTIDQMGFKLLPFDSNCVGTFARLRSEQRLQAPDAIHLACAASVGIDLFLTNDRLLLKRRLHLAGVHFIVDFTLPIL